MGSGCLVLLAALVGCGAAEDRSAGLGAVGTLRDGFTIGLLLPDRRAARYEKDDLPGIVRAVAAACPRCTVVYRNADGDQARQWRQMAALLDDGVQVLILDAVRPGAAAPFVARAKLLGAKVVAYDRLANGPIDAYAAADPVEVGRMQGRALLDAVRARGGLGTGSVVLLNGPPDDPDTAPMKKGLHSVLDGRVTIGWERDVPPGQAAQEAGRAVSALGPGRVAGVCCASDSMAGRVAAVMAERAVPSGTPLVGRGGARPALLRILLGFQTATVRTPIPAVAAAAGRLAVETGRGRTVNATTMVANGTTASIPAVTVPPELVTGAGARAVLAASAD